MKDMPPYSFYYFLMVCGIMSLAFSFKQAAVATPTRGCSEVERDALLAFKANVKDPSHRLASWSPQKDCCKWSGVVCRGSNSKTHNASLLGGQHVVELNLQNPNVGNEQTFQTALRGEMLSPSLLNLTRLERLNLSWNDFEGTPIPHFIGSFQKLKYLELSVSNFSGEVPSQLGNLSSLYHLGLMSSGWYVGARPVAHRLDWLSGLSSLAYLDMSSVNLSKVTKNWLSEVNMLPFLRELYLVECDLNYIHSSLNPYLNLTSLIILDLAGNDFNSVFPNWLWNLTKLSTLDLSYSNFLGPIPTELWALSSLAQLSLASNRLKVSIPISVANLTSLHSLFLSDCSLHGQIPSQIGNLTSLTILDLSWNSFSDSIPVEIGNLTSLTSLDLSDNSFSGSIPAEIGKLTSLTSLNLFRNSLSGFIRTEIENLSNLTYLNLGGNLFSGPIPIEIGNLTSLTSLKLAWNLLSGPVPIVIGNFTSLTFLDLSHNSLFGPIPTEIGKLFKLQELDLSRNSLVSVLSEQHFANLTILYSLILRENSRITISFDYEWVPPFQLERINLASCIVGPKFPQWLRSQKSMFDLSLSNTSINDILPHWFWDSSSTTFSIIDLSHNMLRGTLPSSFEKLAGLDVLTLDFNKFEGLIPRWPPQISVLDLSFNNFSGSLPSTSFYFPSWQGSYDSIFHLMLSNNQVNGSIPSYICNFNQLHSLDLSNNQLFGEIPKCWQKAAKSLNFIHLGNNKLTGKIPRSLGNLIGLQSLHLNNNNLGEHLPPSLQNCNSLVILDLADNKFSGRIPMWIGQSLPQLTILRLRSNDFFGIIPPNLGELKNIQVVDLANNNLSGEIPYSFGNFSAITSTIISRAKDWIISTKGEANDIEYGELDSISIVTKGYEYIFSSTLYLVKSIDLSNNYLIGEIPITLGSLAGLQTLNLSRNKLRGKIPYTIGAMKSLETLDLSFNNLSGVIPQSLSTLTGLNHLNLSYNNLSGRIPSGNQLQTLEDASIYKGNIYLCGVVIQRNCSDYTMNNLIEGHQNSASLLLSFYLGSFVGYATGLWSVFIILLCKKKWRYFYFQMIDKMYNKVWVAVKIRMPNH